MLHANAQMLDIDVDQWRAAQDLILHSGKAAPRLVIIHDHGRVQKARFSDGEPLADAPTSITDPRRTAAELFAEFNERVEFVMVMERDAVDDYFVRVQGAWTIDADLDDFVTTMFAALDDDPEGIVVHPGPASGQLGLQWRLGWGHEEIVAKVASAISPDSWVVLGSHDVDRLVASLLIHFDEDLEVDLFTTAAPERVDLIGGREEVLERLIDLVGQQGGRVGFALSVDHQLAPELLAATDKARVIAAHPGEATVRTP